MIWLFGGSIPLWMVFKHEAFVSIHCSSMQKTRPHTCCETSSQSKGCIFSKEIRKKLPSGKTNFPFASISTSWTFWRKTLFLGDVPIAVCSLYIFPPYVPIQRRQKRSTFCLFPPPEEVHQSTLCRWPRTSTCWHPKPRFFWTTTLFDRRGEVFPGETKMETSNGWRTSENRWRLFFVWFLVFLWVDSWKLLGKKTWNQDTQDTPIVIVMNALISFWFFSLKFPMLCVMANKIIVESH